MKKGKKKEKKKQLCGNMEMIKHTDKASIIHLTCILCSLLCHTSAKKLPVFVRKWKGKREILREITQSVHFTNLN